MNSQAIPWFHAFRERVFPTAVLPADLATCVRFEAARFGVNEALVAVTALARLGGTLAEYRSIPSLSGLPVPLLLRVIMAVPPDLGTTASLRESGYTLEAIQHERLQVAAGLDHKRIQELRDSPQFMLPDYVDVPGGEPREVTKARHHALDVARQPLFLLSSPGSRELRAGFAASFDRAVFATFDQDLLEPLLSSKRDREKTRLGDLVARLCRGGQIDVPGMKAGPGMVQPRFGFLCITTSDVLARAIASDLDDLRAVARHSILLDLSAPATAAPQRVDPRHITQTAMFWKHLVSALYQERLRYAYKSRAHTSFYEPLAGWHQRLQTLSADIPEHLRPHLQPFYDLPQQLANLFLAVGGYGVWQDARSAQSALELTEWLLARTLLVAEKAHGEKERTTATDTKEKMLAKIIEFGPIDFWRLCRRYDRQDKTIHEPVLHALMEEKRVRLNPEGRLVAA